MRNALGDKVKLKGETTRNDGLDDPQYHAAHQIGEFYKNRSTTMDPMIHLKMATKEISSDRQKNLTSEQYTKTKNKNNPMVETARERNVNQIKMRRL